jgi:hypothetical protein
LKNQSQLQPWDTVGLLQVSGWNTVGGRPGKIGSKRLMLLDKKG